MNPPQCIWALGAELGEGPLWMADSQQLYFVDILGKQVYRCAGDGGQRQSWPMPRRVGFILPMADSDDMVVGLQGSLQRFNPRTGELQHLLDVAPERAELRINDGHVDAQGRLWFGTMHMDCDLPIGHLYRVSATGALLPQDGPYVCTNGPAQSPDGRALYHTDTMQQAVWAFDVADDGALSGKRLFASFKNGYPDGTAVDAEGHVWIALFAGGRIERYTPQGQLVQTVPFPCSNVTKLAFGGPDLRTAFATTARTGLSPQERAAQPLAGGLFSFRVDTPGLLQHHVSEGFAP
ncbi:MAG: SMP-30/gluconolactonase/LRE family protein [Chitinophagaceae bacterium]|nr:SMP-30/gluconolactonase/LRE family protein [Rubrivivax sp.]